MKMIIILKEEMKNSQLEIKKKTTENNWEKSINPLNNITKTKTRRVDGGKYSRPKNKKKNAKEYKQREFWKCKI